MVKLTGLIGLLMISTCLATSEFCYNDVEDACSSKRTETGIPLIPNCNAKYGIIDDMQTDLQAYANAHIETSFEFLLMSTHFGNYEVNREGFKGLYRKLSDKAWDNAIDVIKFIAKRGGKMNFGQLPRVKRNVKNHVLELSELSSLAKALDTQKNLADEALRLHAVAQHHVTATETGKHRIQTDASIAHYIEEKFVEDQAEVVRTLSGHTNDLKNLVTQRDPLAVYLFDEYLQKTLL